MNRRRLLIAAGAGCAFPVLAHARQEKKVWRVGFLASRAPPEPIRDEYFGAFSRGMRELGYVEGRNLAIEWRFAAGSDERLPRLATELVHLKVDVIVTAGTPASLAAQRATTTLPIVMGSIFDPVGSGLVASLSRPGGNVTGVANILGEVMPKQVEMLVRMVPGLARLAVLANPGNVRHARLLEDVQAAAARSGVTVLVVALSTPGDLDRAFLRMREARAQALITLPDSLMTQERQQLVARAIEQRLPAMFAYREFVEAGGLMSYGQNNAEQYRRAAVYVDRILRGAKPRDLPVEQPTNAELVISRKTAQVLRLAVPPELLVRAEMID